MKKLNFLLFIAILLMKTMVYSIAIINNSKEKILIGFNGAKESKKNVGKAPFLFWIYSDELPSIDAKEVEEVLRITKWPNEIFTGFQKITLSEYMTRDEFDNPKNTLTILEDGKMILEIDNDWHLSVTDLRYIIN